MLSDKRGQAPSWSLELAEAQARHEAEAGLELSRRELVVLSFCSATLAARLEVLDALVRFRLLDPREIDRLHDRMSAAIDAGESQAPSLLAARVQHLLDEALGDLLGLARSRRR
jgi:hypothetical protein